MLHSNAELKNENGITVLQLEGSITNESTIPIVPDDVKVLHIDFARVRAINSQGICKWLDWTKTVSHIAEVVVKDCPKVIVDQINMIPDFLPENARLESFNVPYFCEECSHEEHLTYRQGREFNFSSGGIDFKNPSEVKCPQCSEHMQLDVFEAKYFKFLGIMAFKFMQGLNKTAA